MKAYDADNCFSRLPCGICRLTNSMCPLLGSQSNYENSPTCFGIDYVRKETQTMPTAGTSYSDLQIDAKKEKE